MYMLLVQNQPNAFRELLVKGNEKGTTNATQPETIIPALPVNKNHPLTGMAIGHKSALHVVKKNTSRAAA